MSYAYILYWTIDSVEHAALIFDNKKNNLLNVSRLPLLPKPVNSVFSWM